MKKPPTPFVAAANKAGMNGDTVAAYRALLPEEPTPAMLTAMTSAVYWPNQSRAGLTEMAHAMYRAMPAWQELWVTLVEKPPRTGQGPADGAGPGDDT